MINKIRNTIKQWFVVRWGRALIVWCFRRLCFIVQWLWERCTFNNFLMSIIFVGGVIMLALAVRLLWEARAIWRDGSELKNSYGLLQALIWSMGGVGAAIGLWFSNQRQKTFAKQVQSQVDQVQVQSEQVQVQSEQVQVQSEQVQREVDKNFDDRLGRGIELLAKEDVGMRSAGIRILVNLADNVKKAQKSIVTNIIYDFVRGTINVSSVDNSVPNKKSHQDVQNALDFLINLSLDERRELLPNRLVGDKLDLSYLDFSYLEFSSQTLENIDFSKSYFNETKFRYGATIESVNFSGAKIEDVELSGVGIKNSVFVHVRIVNSSVISCGIGDENSVFSHVIIERSYFVGVTITCTQFDSVKFMGGKFAQGAIKVSPTADLPYFIGVDLSETIFDFDGDIDLNDFLTLCYYCDNQQLSEMDASREYISTSGMKIFVKSKKPWSEEPAEEWVAAEIAERNFERFDETGEDPILLEAEFEAAKERLHYARIKFQRRREKFNNPNPK